MRKAPLRRPDSPLPFLWETRKMCIRDSGYTSTGHELLHALALGAGVVVAVTFQQVDNAPDTETGTERDNEGRCV